MEKEFREAHPELFHSPEPGRHNAPRSFLNVMMKDVMNREDGNVAPDTIGADYFFIEGFITPAMEKDFPEITKEFLAKCYPQLEEFAGQGWSDKDHFYDSDPATALRRRILNLILSGAKYDNGYAKALLTYLYKTYHKKEYNQLKRFRKIHVDEILSIAEPYDVVIMDDVIGRILCMCPVLGIELDDMCSILYLTLEEKRKEYESWHEEDRNFPGFRDGLYRECLDIVDSWMEQDKDRTGYHKCMKYWEENDFLGICFQYEGYPDGYSYSCDYYHEGLRSMLTTTLALLRTHWPKREFSYEDVQRYANVYSTARALAIVSDELDDDITDAMGILPDRYIDDRSTGLFHPEKIQYNASGEKKESKRPQYAGIAPVGTTKAKDQDYLDEIARLRSRLHEQEQKSSEFRSMYQESRKELEKSLEILRKYEDEHAELSALREYVYHLSEDSPVSDFILAEEKQKMIQAKRVILVGGHVSWQNKLKAIYPEWILINPDASRNVDQSILENCDMVYFFTEYINHLSYHRFIGMIRTKKIPFGYLKGRNLDYITDQIYKDLMDK